MEELLPFFAGLAYVAFQIYNNFRKAKEEARTRNPSKPFESKEFHDAEKGVAYTPKQEKPTHSVPTSKAAVPKYHEPAYQSERYESMKEEAQKEPLYKEPKAVIPHRVELYNPEVPVEEVVKTRVSHGVNKHIFTASQEEEVPSSDFDMRDAIIKEAILNRPQY